jgi:hypothetical protein
LVRGKSGWSQYVQLQPFLSNSKDLKRQFQLQSLYNIQQNVKMVMNDKQVCTKEGISVRIASSLPKFVLGIS